MLEDILTSLKRAAAPALISLFSFLPSNAAANYLSLIEKEGNIYIIEIDDGKKQIQIDTDKEMRDDEAEKFAFKALINKKIEELDRHVWDMSYEGVQIFRGPIKDAKEIKGKIDYITSLLKIEKLKFPWWPLALKSPEDFKTGMLAVERAWKYRNTALKMLDEAKKSSNLGKTYEELCLMDFDIQAMTLYLREVNKSPDYLIKRDEIKFILDEFWETFNLKKAEKKIDELKDRYALKAKEVERLKENLEKRLEESREYQNLRKTIKEREIGKVVKKYNIIKSPALRLVEEEYKNIDLWTSANPAFQTENGREKAAVFIKIDKSNIRSEDYNLRLLIMTDKVINKTKTDLFAIYPKDTKIGPITQKAYTFKTDLKGNIIPALEEIVPYGKDKSIVMQTEIIDWVMDKALDTIMRGKIIKTRNVLSYLSDKIYEEQLKESASDVREIIASEKNYKASQLSLIHI